MEAAADRGQDVVASNDPLGGQDQAGAVVLEPVVPTVQFELAVFAVIIGVAVAFQYLLKRWQRESPRSFHLVTLICLWLFPFAFSLYFLFLRMITVWFLFSSITGFLLLTVRFSKPLPRYIPKWVYSWFSIIHRGCYTGAVIGYVLILLQLVIGLPTGILGFYIALYALYFGVLSRDVAEFTAENLVTKLGYYGGRDHIPSRSLSARICALCDQELDIGGGDNADIRILNCGHRYHDLCIRGWAMVGKKDTCAYCQEKIDLKDIASESVWQNISLQWGHILDALRYLIVWNPIILLAMHIAVYIIEIPFKH